MIGLLFQLTMAMISIAVKLMFLVIRLIFSLFGGVHLRLPRLRLRVPRLLPRIPGPVAVVVAMVGAAVWLAVAAGVILVVVIGAVLALIAAAGVASSGARGKRASSPGEVPRVALNRPLSRPMKAASVATAASPDARLGAPDPGDADPQLDLFLRIRANHERLALTVRDLLERFRYGDGERAQLESDLRDAGIGFDILLSSASLDTTVELRIIAPPELFELRGRVDAEGQVAVSVRQLLAMVGRQRLTVAARDALSLALLDVGLDPDLQLDLVQIDDGIQLMRAGADQSAHRFG